MRFCELSLLRPFADLNYIFFFADALLPRQNHLKKISLKKSNTQRWLSERRHESSNLLSCWMKMKKKQICARSQVNQLGMRLILNMFETGRRALLRLSDSNYIQIRHRRHRQQWGSLVGDLVETKESFRVFNLFLLDIIFVREPLTHFASECAPEPVPRWLRWWVNFEIE